MGIRTKLVSSYLSVAILVAVAGFFGWFAAREMVRMFEGGEQRIRATVAASTALSFDAKRLQSDLIWYLTFHEAESKQRLLEISGAIKQHVVDLESIVETPEARGILEKAKVTAAALLTRVSNLAELHDREYAATSSFDVSQHSASLLAVSDSSSMLRSYGVDLAQTETDHLNRQEAILAATRSVSFAERAEGHLLLYLTLGDEVDRAKFFQRIASLEEQIRVLDRRVLSPVGVRLVSALRNHAEQLALAGKELIKAYDRAVKTNSRFILADHREFLQSLRIATHQVDSVGMDLAQLKLEMETRPKAIAMYHAANLQRNVLLVAVIAIIVALGLGFWISHGISRPIAELSRAAREIGKGNLGTKVGGGAGSEIGELISTFNKMSEDLFQTTVSKDYVENIISGMAEALIVTSAEGIIQRVNMAAAHLLGYSEDELLDKPFSFVVPDHVADDSQRRGLSASASYARRESTLLSKSGQHIPVICSISQFTDSSGAVQGMVFTAQDISELKQAEQALCESEERFKQVADNAGEWIWEVDPKGMYRYCSSAVERILGYSPEELVGQKHFYDLFPQDAGEELKTEALRAFGSGEPFRTFVNRNVHKNGSLIILETSGSPIRDERGILLGYRGTDTDITERKRAEEALERRIIALTRPLDETEGIAFEDLFNLDEIQKLQDQFAKAVGVGSLITLPDGTPITKPSNFCRLCEDVVRKTDTGLINCHLSDSEIGKYNPDGPTIQACLSAGLGNAGTAITVGGRHIANWLIGQVRNEMQDADVVRAYARTIEADEEAFMEAYHEVPYMPQERFASVAQALHTLGRQLSTVAYQNVQQARFIAERKRAEEALQQSEERYRALYEDNPTMYFTMDAQGTVLSVNRFGTEELGYSVEESVGQPVFKFFHPEDRAAVREQLMRCLQNPMQVAHWELRKVRKDGSVLWVKESARAARTADGNPVVLVVCEDITETKRAERELQESNDLLRAIIEAAPTPIVGLDLDGNVRTVWNPAAEKMLGWSAEEVMGRLLPSVPAESQEEFRSLRELIRGGKTLDGVEVRRQRRDGAPIDYSIYASPLHDAEGRITGNVFVLVDVTERKQAEKEREKLQAQLLQAQKMEAIGTLAGGIAHDFNNLLQVVLGYSDVLLSRRKPKDPEYAPLRAIREAGRGGSELAKRILAFGRRLEPNARPLSLNNEIKRVQKMLARMVPKMIRIDLNLADDLMIVNADAGQLEQILLNLAVNAQHAMPDGGRLTIETANVTLDADYSRTHLDMEPGKYVLLTISDTGHGMNREVVQHIFEPFYTTKGPGEGTGLGLAMVFGIVKSHNGHITCYSEPGTGTTFKIYLPAIVQEIEEDVADTRQMLPFGTETILLVDDENSVRKLGEEMLRMAGYCVLTATNGIEALEVYQSNTGSIALVVLDLIMPEMGGKQCLEELLKINPDVKVVIGSGYSANGPTKDVIAAGAKGFVSKPFSLGQLLLTVRNVLDEA